MSKLVPFLAAATGLTETDVRSIISRAPVSYKYFEIAKRTGGKRLISQPAREVKALQRLTVRRLRNLPIHDCAMAYRSGYSIRDNAARHAANGPILKFDFKDFFHSIRAEDWEAYCREKNVFSSDDDVWLSSQLLFHRPPAKTVLRLAMGAPSSPWISNVLLYAFDEMIYKSVKGDYVTYTRYADDLTFSARRTGYLTIVEDALRRTLKEIRHPKLTINDEKTVLATTKFRRMVTGLVLADDGRVTIGRDRKRIIRAALHRAYLGTRTSEENAKLAGWLAFVLDVEPSYFEKLERDYGSEFLKSLTHIAGRKD